MRAFRFGFGILLVVVAGWVAVLPARAQSADELAALNRQVGQLYQAGKYGGAIEVGQSALAMAERLHGPDHPEVATTLNNLAGLYESQGRYAEAEPLYKRSLAIAEKALGPDHPSVAATLNNLALLYQSQGRYAEAEPLYKRSLAVAEKALGPDHPHVATTLNNLASLYRSQARYAEAEPLHKRDLAITEKALGPDHPDVATALGNLALLYQSQGRYPEAEPLHKRSLAIAEKALGPDHPEVATTLNNLAELYRAQGRYPEAEPLYKRSLSMREKALGPEHPYVAQTLMNLAELYRADGRTADAEPLYKRSLTIGEKALGLDHPQVATTLNNLALLYRSQGRYAEAEPLYKRSLAVAEKALGPDHPDVATTLMNLADLYRADGRAADAEPLFERAKAIPKFDIKELAILFGTNRQRDGAKQTVAFGGERAEQLVFGHGVVMAGREQVRQRAERRAAGVGMLDKSAAALTSEQVLAIRRIVPQETATSFESVRARLRPQAPGERQAFVFVHGYNVGFEDALKRTAQIAFDLDFSGACLLFTWPSSAALLGYGRDQDSADIAVNYLIEFLDAAARQMPNTRLHFLAHSMGNQVLLGALEKMALRGAGLKGLALGEIILAHPDVDQDRFRQLVKGVKGLGARLTLYMSGDDRALWVSKLLRGTGRAGGEPLIVPGVETIDISGLGTSLWSTNHNVYASNPLLFGDLSRLIAAGQRPPDKRTPVFEAVKTEQGTYWRYRAPVAEVAKR